MVALTIERVWIAYKATSRTSGKSYIGIISQGLPRRWQGHLHFAFKKKTRTPFHRAIRKYGVDDFHVRQIAAFASMEEALSGEIELIRDHGTLLRNGYNSSPGGGMIAAAALVWTEERRRKVREALTGRKIPPEIVEKVAAKLRGRKLSPEHAAIISVAGRKNRGRKHIGDKLRNMRIAAHARSSKLEHDATGCERFGTRWRARLWRKGRTVPLGTFDTLEEAKTAWRTAHVARLEEIKTGVDNPMFSVDGRAMQGAAMKRRWQDPAHREKIRKARAKHKDQ